MIVVTNHARKRFKERLGLPKRACQRQAEKAMDVGRKHSDAKGKARKYMNSLFLRYKKANNMRVYGEAIYVFKGAILITVMHFPFKMDIAFNELV